MLSFSIATVSPTLSVSLPSATASNFSETILRYGTWVLLSLACPAFLADERSERLALTAARLVGFLRPATSQYVVASEQFEV